MIRIAKQLIVLIALGTAALAQAPQLKEAQFTSNSLARTMTYRILLPASYETGKQTYPVLYLLHGLYGDYKNWTGKTEIAKYADGLDLIIVMPDANDSWYTNWDTDPKQKFEDYIVKDLISEIEGHYRTFHAREGRWIAGLSMGGYGAIKFGLKYPQLFSVVGSFSGAFDAPTRLQQEVPAFAAQLEKVFGPANSATRANNNILELVRSAKPETTPYLFITCGTGDRFLDVNRDFVSGLPALKLRYQYHELPGGHEWPFWDRSIHDFLREFAPILAH